MSDSYSSNSLVDIKPNRFYRARFRNIRWTQDNTVDIQAVNAKDSEDKTYIVPDAPVINNSNATINRIRDRYNQ